MNIINKIKNLLKNKKVTTPKQKKKHGDKPMFNINPSKKQVAVITPLEKGEYLTNTVIDGLLWLEQEGEIDFYITENYPTPFMENVKYLPDEDFVDYAKKADIILFFRYEGGFTRFDLANQINRWDKTLFFDGTESKHNGRLDFDVQKGILNFQPKGWGGIDKEMLEKCALYFRREKPYLDKIIPFPFGIERRYLVEYKPKIKKDIDFVCIYGQDEYPLMRRYSREILEDFCDKNNFTYHTKRTSGFVFDDKKKAGRDEFYSLLARAKVGISVSGGGYDTARFWEILGNNCILLTEKIDIYEPDSKKLDYKRVWQFGNLYDFKYQLEKVGQFLKKEYKQEDLVDEYEKIMSEHSTKARVLQILDEAKKINLIK